MHPYRLSALITLFTFTLSSSSPLLACTTFLIPSAGDQVMGKSFDWHEGQGFAVVNKRNLSKKGVKLKPTDKPAEWVSKYGSLTLNQVGREFPLSGLNEAGLAIEIMVGGNIDPAQGDRRTLNELQWIQYQLDNYATVREVIEHAPEIHISRVQIMVHYLICDKTAACGVVEFIDGKLVTRSGDQMVVNTLANDTYDDSVTHLKQFEGFGGLLPIPKSLGSLDRFARATALARQYDPASGKSLVDHAFEVLNSVFVEDYSQWNMAYELTKGRINYRTLGNRKIRTADATTFDYSCKSKVKVIDIQQGQGDITNSFVDYTYEANQNLVDLALKSAQAQLPPGTLQALGHYPESTVCLE